MIKHYDNTYSLVYEYDGKKMTVNKANENTEVHLTDYVCSKCENIIDDDAQAVKFFDDVYSRIQVMDKGNLFPLKIK